MLLGFSANACCPSSTQRAKPRALLRPVMVDFGGDELPSGWVILGIPTSNPVRDLVALTR